jgi:hypothetical protein
MKLYKVIVSCFLIGLSNFVCSMNDQADFLKMFPGSTLTVYDSKPKIELDTNTEFNRKIVVDNDIIKLQKKNIKNKKKISWAGDISPTSVRELSSPISFAPTISVTYDKGIMTPLCVYYAQLNCNIKRNFANAELGESSIVEID